MKTFRAQSPTRVDLAGGTLDLWPLNCFIENCLTVNIAINIYTHCELQVRSDSEIHILSRDQKFEYHYKNWQEFISSTQPECHFFRVHAGFWKPSWGFNITTDSQSPLGGGLGGSSSLSVSVMKVFSQAMGQPLSLQEMVTIGHNLEAAILKTPTGIQDFVPAVDGGINCIAFEASGFKVLRSKISPQFYNEHALLVYTGRPHHSGLNNFEVLKNAVLGNEVTWRALRGIRDVAIELWDRLEKNDLSDFRSLLAKEYDYRIQLTSAFTSPEIEKLRTEALRAGAEAIKICGAGGGGCVMVWCRPEQKNRVKTELLQKGFVVLETQVVNG